MKCNAMCVLMAAGAMGLAGFGIMGGFANAQPSIGQLPGSIKDAATNAANNAANDAAKAAAKEATKAAAPATGGYKIDPVHASVVFGVKHMNTSNFYGRFNDISGSFSLIAGAPEKSFVEVNIKAASVDTNNKDRDKHVMGPQFFAAEKFPMISFKSTSIKVIGEDQFEATGQMTFRGETKTITVKIEKTGEQKGMKGEPIAGFESRFTIKRSDYGSKELIGPVGDEVSLIVAVEGAM